MANQSLTFILVDIKDTEQLLHIAKATFLDAYASKNTKKNMDDYIQSNITKSQLEKQIANAHSEFYFIKLEQQTIGYIKLNEGPAQTELQESDSIEIERIYLYSNQQGKGFGTSIMDYCKSIALNKNLQSIWLGVWDQNPRAIVFYKRMGFDIFDEHVFVFGDQQQTDIMMRYDMSMYDS